MKKYKSEISEVVYRDAEAMHRVGIISDERMREYAAMCLENPVKQKSNRTLPPAEYTSRFFQTERLATNRAGRRVD
jgi:DNA-binding transcriptional regulator YiaG